MAQNNLYLAPKASAVGVAFAGTFKELLEDIAKHMGIGGSAKSLSFGSATPAVEDQDKPWLKLDSNSDSLGWHIYTGTKWAPIEPIGKIHSYQGDINDIPAGYRLCDGVGTYLDKDGATVNIPDLRDRFLLGAGNTFNMNDVTGLSIGGNITIPLAGLTDSHTLITSEIPAHTHVVPNISGAEADAGDGGTASPVVGNSGVSESTGGGAGHTHNLSGVGTATMPTTDVLPPSFALAFIIYTAL